MTKALQVSKNKASGGSNHVVGIGELRVLITQQSKSEWYAQGLEIDYLAQGTNLKEVKKSFEKGLVATIRAHLQMLGDIKSLLQPASAEAWEELYKGDCEKFSYSSVSVHRLSTATDDKTLTADTGKAKRKAAKGKKPQTFPFTGIKYLRAA